MMDLHFTKSSSKIGIFSFTVTMILLSVFYVSTAILPDAYGQTDRQITQLAQQVAKQTGVSQTAVKQTIQQLSKQIEDKDGNANQAITQLAQQVAKPGSTTAAVSQSIAQIAKQQASGGGANAKQAIT